MSPDQFSLREVERLRAVLNGLRQAVVTVDGVTGQASVNLAAAALLDLPHGTIDVGRFMAALAELAAGALNSGDVVIDPDAAMETTLRFARPPTHLLVTSSAISSADFTGRIWVFYDESDLSQALESAERERGLLRSSANGMLDPQALLEGVRDAGGRIVDFVYRDVNRATCEYLGMARDQLVGRTLLETMPNLGPSGLLAHYVRCAVTHEPMIFDDAIYDNEILSGPRYYDIRGNHAGGDFITLTWRDVTERFETAQRIRESEKRFRLLAENAGDVVVHVRDGRIAWASPSIEEALGAPPEHWVGRELLEIIPEEDRTANDKLTWLAKDRAVIPRGRVIAVDGTVHWVHAHVRTFYDSDGNADGYTSAFRIIDDEVRATEEIELARGRQAEADARYRRLMDNSAVGMCLVGTDGRYEAVNQALCDFLGYDADTLTRMRWQDVTTGATLERDLHNAEEVLAGRADRYRVVKQYVRSDGRLVWGDLSVSCLRDESGQVEYFISQVIDITVERTLAQRLQEQSDRLTAELESAAAYVASLIPANLSGPVTVASRYLPSRELAGDCFDYRWIDDDHLIVYLLDVSGHGVAPALVSISVHNMLRSAALPKETMLAPDKLLAELNRQFQMDQQGGNYFTLWYGVYQKSTRRLCFASAGHPPALMFTSAGAPPVTLSTDGVPVGMFGRSEFASRCMVVPHGSRMLLYSDGVYEWTLPGGENWSVSDFVYLCSREAQSRDWSLDSLVGKLRARTMAGAFEDDCSLVLLDFD